MATQNGLNNSSAPFTVTTGTLTVSAGNAIITNNTSPVLMELICTSNDTILGTIGILKQHGAGNAVVTGDSIGQISFLGFDGTNYVQTGVMQSISSGTIAANRVAGSLFFGTHPDSTAGGLNATTRMTIAPTGAVTINQADSGLDLTVAHTIQINNGVFSVNNDGTTATPIGVIGCNQTSNDASGGAIQITKQHGTGSAIVSGDTVGNYLFYGFDGTNFVQAALISCVSSGTIAANRVAGTLLFLTHPNSTSGGLGATQRMSIGPAGNIVVATPDSGIAINSPATYAQSGLGATTQIMVIDSTGNIGSSSAITSSSALLTAGGTLSSVGAADYRAPSDNGLSATEALIQIPIPVACTLSNLYVNVTANASTTNVTVTVRKNGSSTAIVATITALTTGAFTDTTHSATFAAGDLISYQISASTVGVVTGSIGLKLVG